MARKRILVNILGGLLVLGLNVSVLGQGVYEAWVAKYNGPGNGPDYALALTEDSAGNVYVTGYGMGSVTGDDYATIKYAPNGDTLWVRSYNGPLNFFDRARAIAVDDSGNVYVTGGSYGTDASFDYATIKYSPDGSLLWDRRYNGPVGHDEAYDLEVDKSGYVYVTGQSEGSGTDFLEDYATIKYSPDGNTLWVRRYNGTGNDYDYASALAVDTAGNVCVTGRSWGGPYNQGGTNEDYATLKYSSSGATIWAKRYDYSGTWDGATAVAVDRTGNVYVTGYSGAFATGFDYATIKYAPNGDTLWVRRYNGPGNSDDFAHALAVDTAGNVCVTGFSTGSGTGYDYATIKYAPNGDTLWVRRYNGPENDYDYASAVKVDSAGNVYVSGESKGSGSSSDYTTIKYASNGDTMWVRRYNGPPNPYDYSSALAVDNAGNAHMARWGYGTGPDCCDYATIKYSPCSAIPGDADADSTYTLADIISMVNYYFKKPDWPSCSGNDYTCWLKDQLICRGDWNGNQVVGLDDIIRAVNYYFKKPGWPACPANDYTCWLPPATGACCLPVP